MPGRAQQQNPIEVGLGIDQSILWRDSPRFELLFFVMVITFYVLAIPSTAFFLAIFE